jgi:hypothetical protein
MRRFSYALVTGLSLSLLPAVSLAAPASPSSPTVKVEQVTHARAAKATQALKNDKTRYAEREAASPQAQTYRGGDTVVIGATTATAILAIILLIVLI